MAGYGIEKHNRYFEANRRIVESEIKPAHTVTFVSDVDLTRVEVIRSAMGEARPSYTAFVVKAVAEALNQFPYANRRVCRLPWWPFGKRLQKFHSADVAVAAERDMPGIEYCAFADVIRQADQLPLSDVNQWLRDLATCDVNSNKQWREFSTIIRRVPSFLAAWLIRMPVWIPGMWVKYRGGAVLISSPAKYGVDCVMATWTWPLGISFGFVKPKPFPVGDKTELRPSFSLTLNFDRRVMAGAQGARFFKCVVDQLENFAQADIPAGEVQDSTNGHNDLSEPTLRVSA